MCKSGASLRCTNDCRSTQICVGNTFKTEMGAQTTEYIIPVVGIQGQASEGEAKDGLEVCVDCPWGGFVGSLGEEGDMREHLQA